MGTRRLISSGSRFEAAAGCSRAVVDGDLVRVSGTPGIDDAATTIDPDPVAQARRALAEVAAALAQAGCALDDVVRVRYLLTDAATFERVAPVFAEAFARARPAATAMVVGLLDPRMRIQIEVDARVPAPPAPSPHDWGPQSGI